MTVKIDADTTSGLQLESDTSGIIDIQSGGTTKMTVGTTIDIQGNELVLDADADTSIHADTDDQIDFKVGGTDRMHIASNGYVGIGTSSPDTTLEVSEGSPKIKLTDTNNTISETALVSHISAEDSAGTQTWRIGRSFGSTGFDIINEEDSSMDFMTNGTQRMRITNDGRIGIGGTNGVANVHMVIHDSTPSLGFFFVGEDDAGSDKIRIETDGDIKNTNNSYGSLSDQKLKENIVDATNKLEELKQVRIRNFNLIGDDKKQIGVIAQELEQIFPSMIKDTPDVDEDGNDLGTVTKSVKYSVFVPILIKSLQEQQAIIEDLQTRITALENN